jgi:hypothetical protein
MLVTSPAFFRVAAALAALGWSAGARAQDATACKAAFERADVLLHADAPHRLLETRDELRVCASPSCRPWMVDECTRELRDVEARIPTVVLVARDDRGADVPDVAVTAGGALLLERLDGRAVEVDPGEHLFAFTAPDGRRVERRAVVREGERAQIVSAVFGSPRSHVEAPAVPRARVERRESGAPLRTLAWIAVGTGAAALAIGAAFGVVALGDKAAAKCDAEGRCDPGPLADARSAATVSTVGFAAGGALLAGGAALLFAAPW